jgi:hypothetical protein
MEGSIVETFPAQKETGLPMKKEAGQLNQIYDWF